MTLRCASIIAFSVAMLLRAGELERLVHGIENLITGIMCIIDWGVRLTESARPSEINVPAPGSAAESLATNRWFRPAGGTPDAPADTAPHPRSHRRSARVGRGR